MVEKRRGLGRGLGALIPSAPADEERPTRKASESADVSPDRAPVDDGKRKQEGRPVDLFFERVTEEDVAEQPRSYSSALRSGINKNVLEAQTKRVGKTSRRSSAEPRQELSVPEGSGEEPSPGHPEDGPSDKQSTSYTGGATEAPDLPATGAAQASAAAGDVQVPAVDGQRPADNGGMPGQTIQRPANNGQLLASGPETAGPARDDSVPASDDGQGSAAAQGRNVSRETSTSVSRPSQAVADGAGPDQNDGLVDVPGATFADLPLDSIHPNRKQPRLEFDEDELAELVHSIREIGVLQPIVVRPSHEGGDAPYELVMGERRWRASRDAGMETIPAIIRVTLDDDLLRDALLENLHRSALNPLEEAAAYQQLLDDFGCSHDELAGRLGRSRPQISNTLRLMKLPPLVQRRVAAGVLSAGHARALLGLADVAEMEKLAQRIVSEGLSVRSTEEIVALSGGLRRATRTSPPKDGGRHERLDYLATSLSDRLDTNVKITLGAKKGRVSIEFASVDDLNRIVSVLSPSAE